MPDTSRNSSRMSVNSDINPKKKTNFKGNRATTPRLETPKMHLESAKSPYLLDLKNRFLSPKE